MKTGTGRIIIASAIFLILVSVCGAEGVTHAPVELRLTEDLTISEIETDVFLVKHSFPWPANSLLVRMDDDMLWIDTPYTPEATASVLAWVYDRFGADISITEINTGFHIDNLGGNRALLEHDIPVYGSDLTVELLRSKSSATMSTFTRWLAKPELKRFRDSYAALNFAEPTITFDINREQSIILGGQQVILFYPGPTHTFDNLTVYIPGRKLLFGGCMLLAAGTDKVGYAGDGDLTEWSKSLSVLTKRFGDPELVIPGHGQPGGSRLIDHTIEVVNAALR